MKTIMFICTGNFYRSRFAEALFNYHAKEKGFEWRAISRGLMTYAVSGDISPYTVERLRELNIGLENTTIKKTQLQLEDLEKADHTVALKKDEHYPMMKDYFPDWANKIEYWAVHDIDFKPPTEALPEIEALVQKHIALV